MEMNWKVAAYFAVMGYIAGTALASLLRGFIADAAADGARRAPRLELVPPPAPKVAG
jgi:hypothetical protein